MYRGGQGRTGGPGSEVMLESEKDERDGFSGERSKIDFSVLGLTKVLLV